MECNDTPKKCMQTRILPLFYGISVGSLAVGLYFTFQRQKELELQWGNIKETSAMKNDVSTVPYQSVPVIDKSTSSSLWRPVQDRAKDTVVQIMTQAVDFDWLQPYRTPAQGTLSGTGFFINEDGDIITNAHVVEQAVAIWIQIPSLGKRIIDAHIVAVSPERDLALLRVDPAGLETIRQELGSVPFLPLGDSDLIRRSDEVLALGYPLGQQSLKSTTGVVSGREQHLVQTSAALNPGNSGGPLLNIRGEVIGINVANIPAAQNVGYAIPVDWLKKALPDLYKTKLLRKPFLGVLFNNGSKEMAEYLGNPQPGGAYVVEVVKGSVLEKIGVVSGDMIYEINGYAVDAFGEMSVPWSEDKISVIDYVSRMSIGERVALTIYRYGERKQLSFTLDLAQRPAVAHIYPGLEEVDYEVFGGMVVMQLTKNHIQLLANQAPGLAKFSELRHQNTPTLVITHIFPNSQLFRCRNVAIGSTLNEINGTKVHTLTDLRDALAKSVKNRMLTIRVSDNVTRSSDNIFVVLPWNKVLEEEPRLAQCYRYPLSDNTQKLLAYGRDQQLVAQVMNADDKKAA